MKVMAGAAVLIERSVFDRNLGPTGGAITLDTNSSIIIQVPPSLCTSCTSFSVFIHLVIHTFM